MKSEIKNIAFYLKEFALLKLEIVYCTKRSIYSYLYLRCQVTHCHL